MAPSHTISHKSRSHQTTFLQTPLPSKTARPAHHNQTTANNHSSTKHPSPVIASRISKHRRTTAAVDPKSQPSTTLCNPINHTHKNKPTSATHPPTQALITIHISNRLGTRTSLQCLPTDTIRTLKLLASLKLGIRPEAMLLKRQGQRKLRDGLTLEDYGIGDGSSVDLEVDLGD